MKVSNHIMSCIIICFSLIYLWTIWGCKQSIGDMPSKDSIYKKVHSPVITDTLTFKKKQQLPKDSISVGFKNEFLLPPIKSVKYVYTQTSLERMYLKYIPHFEDSLSEFLKYYNRKLPNFGKYKAYYIYVFCSKDSSSKCICNGYTDYNGLTYGLLIFYDPNSNIANIINASYDFSSDSEHYEMSFSIETNNTIILHENGQTEGEGGEPEDFEESKRIINLSNEGLIQVSGDE